MTDTITGEDLDLSIDLCRRHLAGLQTAQGNFRYEYDWEKRAYADDDNAVRQAGTLWGLANLHRLRPDPELYQACRRGLAFYDQHSGTTAADGRYSTYLDDEYGYTGSTALVALTLIELLRGREGLDPDDERRWRALLDQYLRFLLDSQLPDGRWPAHYHSQTGELSGEPSPYSDGEALLALTRAARHLGYDGLENAIARGAAGCYRRHVLLALRRNHHSRATTGYYQWGTMAMYEIVKAGWPESAQYREIISYLSDWMCDVRRLAALRNNPAASLEGLIHAYDLSDDSRDRERIYRNTISAGLERMFSLQVGHLRAGEYVRRAPTVSPATGGCQHWPDIPTLRIDFAKHQLHAGLLAAEMFVLE